jgi:hypothetical protein
MSKTAMIKAVNRTPATEPAEAVWMRRGPAALALAFTLALGVAHGTAASNATLAATVQTWSRTIGADARSISLAARRRHPRRMTARASRFWRDALHARNAIAAQRASSATGGRAKDLALRAFANYAMAGRRWTASGRARVAHRLPAARTLSRRAATYARTGNRLLLMADRLLP